MSRVRIPKILCVTFTPAFSAAVVVMVATAPWANAAANRVISSVTSDPQKKVRRSIASAPTRTSTSTQTREVRLDDDQSGTGLAIYLGAGGGVMSVRGADLGSELNKVGPNAQGRLSLTGFNELGVLDLGLGWMYNRIGGTETISTATTTTVTEGTVFTRSGVIEVSPRLRVAKRYEIGPIASLLFGTDNTFNEKISGPNAPIFLGLKGAAQWDVKRDVYLRVALSGQGSPTLGRAVFLGAATVELGIPLVGGKTLLRERDTHVVHENYRTETIETETLVTQKMVEEVEREIVSFSFDDQVVHFEFDHATLLPESREFITQLGTYLSGTSSSWGKVHIEGHTDQRGSEEYNLALSSQRTQAVVDALTRAGVPRDRVNAQGFGKSRPVDTSGDDISHARNRRVEMSFTDVADVKEFRNAVNRIRLRTIRPATCAGGRCR